MRCYAGQPCCSPNIWNNLKDLCQLLVRYEVDDQPSFIVLRRLITFMCSEVMIACLDPFPGIGAINSGISIQGNIAVKLFTNERPFTGNVHLLHHQHGGWSRDQDCSVYIPTSIGVGEGWHRTLQYNAEWSRHQLQSVCMSVQQTSKPCLMMLYNT